jgi:ketopantoate reductase
VFGRHSPIPDRIDAEELWITCKRGDLSALLGAWTQAILAPRVGQLRVIFIQNGLGVAEEARLHLGSTCPWTRAALWWGARLDGARLLLTPPPRRMAFAGECDAPFWRSCGFEVETLAMADRDALEWRKALTNLTINALLALHRLPNGALLTHPTLMTEAQALHDEARSVAKGLGISIASRNETWAEVIRTAEATPANRNSLLQDLEAGRDSELEWLNSALVKEAQGLMVAVPHHQKLVLALAAARTMPAAGNCP